MRRRSALLGLGVLGAAAIVLAVRPWDSGERLLPPPMRFVDEPLAAKLLKGFTSRPRPGADEEQSEREQVSPLSPPPRLVAALQLDAGGEVLFVTYLSRGLGVCWDAQRVEPELGTLRPARCRGRGPCNAFCGGVLDESEGVSRKEPRVLAGTVTAAADVARLTFPEGDRLSFRLDAPTVPQLPGRQRAFMVDLRNRPYPAVELLAHGRRVSG